MILLQSGRVEIHVRVMYAVQAPQPSTGQRGALFPHEHSHQYSREDGRPDEGRGVEVGVHQVITIIGCGAGRGLTPGSLP